MSLRTARLVLRRWRREDRAPYAALNADPEVMRHFPAPLTHEQSDDHIRAIEERFDREGFGLWAVEVPAVAPFIGFIGLSRPNFEAQFTPCVEVGWRLARAYWGKGYAPEGGRESLRYGFEVCDLDEIVSFTGAGNANSQRVMQKLGMTSDPADTFDHPSFPPGHPLGRHVLYRITRQSFGAPSPP